GAAAHAGPVGARILLPPEHGISLARGAGAPRAVVDSVRHPGVPRSGGHRVLRVGRRRARAVAHGPPPLERPGRLRETMAAGGRHEEPRMIAGILEAVAHWIGAVIASMGYLGIALCMAIESACIPLPSEVIMPFAGFLVSQGRFGLWGTALAGALGCVVGS